MTDYRSLDVEDEDEEFSSPFSPSPSMAKGRRGSISGDRKPILQSSPSAMDLLKFKAWRDRSRFSYFPLFVVPIDGSDSLAVRVSGELFVSLILNPIFGWLIFFTELYRHFTRKRYRAFTLHRAMLLLYSPASSFALLNVLLYIAHSDDVTVSATEGLAPYLTYCMCSLVTCGMDVLSNYMNLNRSHRDAESLDRDVFEKLGKSFALVPVWDAAESAGAGSGGAKQQLDFSAEAAAGAEEAALLGNGGNGSGAEAKALDSDLDNAAAAGGGGAFSFNVGGGSGSSGATGSSDSKDASQLLSSPPGLTREKSVLNRRQWKLVNAEEIAAGFQQATFKKVWSVKNDMGMVVLCALLQSAIPPGARFFSDPDGIGFLGGAVWPNRFITIGALLSFPIMAFLIVLVLEACSSWYTHLIMMRMLTAAARADRAREENVAFLDLQSAVQHQNIQCWFRLRECMQHVVSRRQRHTQHVSARLFSSRWSLRVVSFIFGCVFLGDLVMVLTLFFRTVVKQIGFDALFYLALFDVAQLTAALIFIMFTGVKINKMRTAHIRLLLAARLELLSELPKFADAENNVPLQLVAPAVLTPSVSSGGLGAASSSAAGAGGAGVGAASAAAVVAGGEAAAALALLAERDKQELHKRRALQLLATQTRHAVRLLSHARDVIENDPPPRLLGLDITPALRNSVLGVVATAIISGLLRFIH